MFNNVTNLLYFIRKYVIINNNRLFI